MNNENAVIYGRLSKGDASLESHEKRNVDYCARNNLKIVARFEDEDTSGDVPVTQRNGGCAMMNRLKHGDIKHLVVCKIARLGRETLDFLITWKSLEQLGVILHIADEGGDSCSTARHWGKMQLVFRIAMAEAELGEIRDRTQKKMDYKFDRHELTGNVPYGFDCIYTFADGHQERTAHAWSAKEQLDFAKLGHGEILSKTLVDNPDEQEWIRLIWQWRYGGSAGGPPAVFGGSPETSITFLSLKSIADMLNQQGVPTKREAGRHMKCRNGRKGGQDIITSGLWSCGNVGSLLASRHTARILSRVESRESIAA